MFGVSFPFSLGLMSFIRTNLCLVSGGLYRGITTIFFGVQRDALSKQGAQTIWGLKVFIDLMQRPDAASIPPRSFKSTMMEHFLRWVSVRQFKTFSEINSSVPLRTTKLIL